MHEITLCQSAFEIIDSQAKLNNAQKSKKRLDGDQRTILC
ncbi:putative hydrogenase nickel incorporation protein [Proteus mirabilis]|uniref:Putative hydrogenase nickel incorporation protein n=1 Tax=Proteus mirabilis TaxID=584 RepID=A0A379FK72_PROMI|nr:putative hydrogenase nickel incorporation protein [Proteus mirabilis]